MPPPVRRAGGPCSQELTFAGHTNGATVGALGAFDFPAWTYWNLPTADGAYPALIYNYAKPQTFTVPGAPNGIRLCTLAAAGCGGGPRSGHIRAPAPVGLYTPKHGGGLAASAIQAASRPPPSALSLLSLPLSLSLARSLPLTPSPPATSAPAN